MAHQSTAYSSFTCANTSNREVTQLFLTVASCCSMLFTFKDFQIMQLLSPLLSLKVMWTLKKKPHLFHSQLGWSNEHKSTALTNLWDSLPCV